MNIRANISIVKHWNGENKIYLMLCIAKLDLWTLWFISFSPLCCFWSFLSRLFLAPFKTQLFICLLVCPCHQHKAAWEKTRIIFLYFTAQSSLKLNWIFFRKTESFDIHCCYKLIYAAIANHSKHHSISKCYLNCFQLSLFSIAQIEKPIFSSPRRMVFNHK